jgi:hypothetical protein
VLFRSPTGSALEPDPRTPQSPPVTDSSVRAAAAAWEGPSTDAKQMIHRFPAVRLLPGSLLSSRLLLTNCPRAIPRTLRFRCRSTPHRPYQNMFCRVGKEMARSSPTPPLGVLPPPGSTGWAPPPSAVRPLLVFVCLGSRVVAAGLVGLPKQGSYPASFCGSPGPLKLLRARFPQPTLPLLLAYLEELPVDTT